MTIFLVGQKLLASQLNAIQESTVKGWVNFDGTVVNSTSPVDLTGVRDSFNVVGVQDNGTGDYAIHWDTDFATANYSAAGGTNANGHTVKLQSFVASSLRVLIYDAPGTSTSDNTIITVEAAGAQ